MEQFQTEENNENSNNGAGSVINMTHETDGEGQQAKKSDKVDWMQLSHQSQI